MGMISCGGRAVGSARGCFAALACASLLLAVPVRASDIKEADYQNQYQVTSANKTSKLMVSKSCSMTLVDKTKPNVAINVAKNGYGSCQLLDNGKVYRGRQNAKKNELELLIPAEKKEKAKVEEWQILGTVDINPSSTKNDAPPS